MNKIAKSGIREIFDLAQGLPDVINLGIGEPDFRVPQFVNDAAKMAIDEGFTRYTVSTGIPELRREISLKLRRDNSIDADPDKEIIITNGATQGIFVLMNCLLEPNDEVLLPSPIFTAYHYAVLIAGASPIEVPLDEKYHLDFDSLEKSVNERTKLVVLGSPSNPTGVVFTEKEVRGLLDFAAEHNLLIISDEIYEKFVYNDVRHFSPASVEEFRKRVITVNGFSKTYAMTGWRLGYCAAEESIINAMNRYNMYNAVCASSVAQAAGIAALRGPQTFFEPVLKEFDARRRLVSEELDLLGLKYVHPSGSFYVFPEIEGNSMQFCKRLLLDCGVAAAPGSSFGKLGEGHIRLCYSISRDRIRKAFDLISAFLSKPINKVPRR